MDATFTAVTRLFEQDFCQAEIARQLKISEAKVRKILITVGLISTEEALLHAQGMGVAEIAEKLGKTRNAVLGRLPYEKGMYDAEIPSENAIRIKKCRAVKEQKEGKELPYDK